MATKIYLAYYPLMASYNLKQLHVIHYQSVRSVFGTFLVVYHVLTKVTPFFIVKVKISQLWKGIKLLYLRILECGS